MVNKAFLFQKKEQSKTVERKPLAETNKLVQLELSLQQEKQKRQGQSEFLATAIHEFKSPLSTVMSSAGLIESYLDEGQIEKSHRHIKRIYASIYEMAHLLQDISSLEKLEAGKTLLQSSSLDINRFIKNITGQFSEETKLQQQITHKHIGPAMVNIDYNLCKRILLNLFYYLQKGKLNGSDIDVSSEYKGEYLYFRLACGKTKNTAIDSLQLSAEFSREDKQANQNGSLGLSIVQRYLEFTNGDLEITQTEGGRSVIRLRIPTDPVA